ncbi:ATP-dependent RNA helicase HrpA [Propionibacteriaceae bacterium Y1685]|uniref:ATP-dependent RNA helicase HrpA n=1 Tax=Microlunatus sp. Y1700 TaxID=3418487 RepID=UPI003B81BF3B
MITYDQALPIAARVEDIAAAIEANPVVIVAGETGSGKTTQLPKICLQLGRTAIAHTQPRRIAARSVAERVAQELGSELGEQVGYQVRFTRKAGKDTQLKIMTDGVLLNEITHDRDLKRYDTIIIDEAHERSLNIDFLLGYLKQLITRRRDLKIIVTSATIDTQRFSEHFDDAPVIEVSGRTYPVELRYRPLREEAITAEGEVFVVERDQTEAIVEAVQELQGLKEWGDILVFLSGEREIRDAAKALDDAKLRHTEVIPLYARLSSAEQHKVFAPHSGQRVVLSTNVAETSLTVPGIRYVIDVGTARISRYSARTKVQRLPIEPISQASANQRSGRCGRTAPGVAIRLYAEDDFESRPEFTEPEILRTNLASVILQMAQARLGDIARFPFVEAPDVAQITDGMRLLTELGALRSGTERDGSPRLTKVGHRLARMPVDPRLARMLMAAEERHCLREVLIIVAGMSIQDPRERPTEKAEQASALHRRFWAPMVGTDDQDEQDTKPDPDGSDFIAWLRLWEYVRAQQRELSGSAFRRRCRDEFLHFLRIREWQDLHVQLRDAARDLGLQRNREPADHEDIHAAILSGLLSQVGLADLKDEKSSPGGRSARKDRRRGPREYLGGRGVKFAINPGSSVARIQPPLVMAGELVETSRLWARTVAGIDARSVEEVGAHLVKRQYAEPHWSARRGSVTAYETVSLYGVPIISRRLVNYSAIDPVLSRELFIRRALVEGDWRTRHEFWARNEEVRAEAAALEERTRRRDILVDDETIFAFYDRHVPAEVVSVGHFDAWWKRQRHNDPGLLDLTLDDLIDTEAAGVERADFPDHQTVRTATGEVDVPLAYVFDPGSGRDGVTATVELTMINQLSSEPFSWQVPGLRTELATELIRSLPKQVRTQFVPAPDHARKALGWLADNDIGPNDLSLPAALSKALRALTGHQADGFDLAKVPPHLLITFDVVENGHTKISGKDLAALAIELRPTLTRSLSKAATHVTRSGATDWAFGTIPVEVELARGGHTALGHPALVDEGGSVGLVVHDDPVRAAQAGRGGLRRLVMINTPDPTKWVVGHLNNTDKFTLAASPYASVPDLLADARLASVGSLITVTPDKVRDAGAFTALCDTVRQDNAERMRHLVQLAAEAIRLRGQVVDQVARITQSGEAVADLSEQVDNLVFPGFLGATPYENLTELPRYLRAALLRAETLAVTPAKDLAGAQTIAEVEDAYAELCQQLPAGPLPDEVAAIGWMIEELRVSLFAQRLGARGPISRKRIMNALAGARTAYL